MISHRARAQTYDSNSGYGSPSAVWGNNNNGNNNNNGPLRFRLAIHEIWSEAGRATVAHPVPEKN